VASDAKSALRSRVAVRLDATAGALASAAADLLVIPCCEGESTLPGDAKPLSKPLAPLLTDRRKRGEFTGKANQLSLAEPHGLVSAKRLLLVGLGKRSAVTAETIRQAMGKAAGQIKTLGVTHIATPLFGPGLGKLTPAAVAQAQAEGLLLGLYDFNLYKTEPKPPVKSLTRATWIVGDRRWLPTVQAALERAAIIADAAMLARDLGNHPSNVATPSKIAELARALAAELKLRCTIMERAEMERLGMWALVGVARGSQEPPKLIMLEYKGGPAPAHDPPIVLVGKTITFDTGGISLKPSENMEQMKDDMSGGAAVLAAIQAAARLKLPVHVIGLLPATENMPSGTAQKPGDIVKTLSGLTIEVINTDAEGRLILADALTYAARLKPKWLVDIATLTGACGVALGKHAIGLIGTAPKLVAALKEAGEATGERTWEMPLWEPYFDQIKSHVADVQNVGGRYGGVITAGAFLSKFVGDAPWAHLDIASTAWIDEPRPYTPKGVTGVGVRLLIEFLSRQRAGKATPRSGGRGPALKTKPTRARR
jgi:leucyl aminopeptidase